MKAESEYEDLLLSTIRAYIPTKEQTLEALYAPLTFQPDRRGTGDESEIRVVPPPLEGQQRLFDPDDA